MCKVAHLSCGAEMDEAILSIQVREGILPWYR
jgi:hypothetical protein